LSRNSIFRIRKILILKFPSNFSQIPGALNRPDTVRITAPESLRYHAIIYIQALNATQNDFDVLRVDLSTHTQETAAKAF
jgi:hypothetical protein